MSPISRRPINTSAPPKGSNATRAYHVYLLPQQHDEVKAALNKFPGGWAEWSDLALQRLQREDEAEQASLLGGLRRTSLAGKKRMTFRAYPHVFDAATTLAKRFSTSIQAVFATAFAMQALSPMADLPKVDPAK